MQAKELHNKFKFKCKRAAYCCDKPMISITPFDIKVICNRLAISSSEFHQRYSFFTADEFGIPRCFIQNKPHCPFKIDNTCTIYTSRPLRCRLYPVGRVFEGEDIFYVVSDVHCPGFESDKKWSIEEWVENQGVHEYDDVAIPWNRFLIKLKDQPLSEEQGKQFKEIFYYFDHTPQEGGQNLVGFMGSLYEKFNETFKASQHPS